jgi:hypothetical protein
MPRLLNINKYIVRTWFLTAERHQCVKNKWLSLSAWLEVIRIERDNRPNTNNELNNSLLTVSNLKQSLTKILRYNNKDSANPHGLYIHDYRP